MSDVKELKRISLEFRRLASNLLGTGYETADISLYRFKEYIDNTIIINDILQNKIKNVVNLINEEYEDELSHLNIDFSIEFNCYEGFVDIDISTL